jgi:glutamate-1-semialdehyde 2,1-aminomutase
VTAALEHPGLAAAPERHGGRCHTAAMSVTPHSSAIDRARIAELTAAEAARLDERTQGSSAMYARAAGVLSGGVASSYQVRDPWPIYLSHGTGPKVWDVDGNELWDFHNGFGSMIQGHAHPAIGRAISERYGLGTHFAAPTEDSVVVGEELARRFRLPKWRYTNSGSEATMDAIRIARAVTGRDDVLKIFGSYHGHHDTVMVSIGVAFDRSARASAPRRSPTARASRRARRPGPRDPLQRRRRAWTASSPSWTGRAASPPA